MSAIHPERTLSADIKRQNLSASRSIGERRLCQPALACAECDGLAKLDRGREHSRVGLNGRREGGGEYAWRLRRTGDQEFPGPRGRDALHPLCRPRQPGCGGRNDKGGSGTQQYRARHCVLSIQLRLCAVSAGRRLVRRPLRRAAHAHRLRSADELGQFAQVLGDGGEVEFVAGAARPAQP